MRRVTVALEPAYEVLVGPGALAGVGPLLAGRRRVAVVSQPDVAARFSPAVRDALAAFGIAVDELLIGDGEEAKSLRTVEGLCRSLVTSGILRGDALVALGGGVVGDTVGFTAAVYHRGVAVVQAPTTLVGQVDAAIGGKTGVNLPEGKNLVGAFHQPLGVVADTSTLESLPEREFRGGLGEVAKYALMPEGAGVAQVLAERREAVLARDPEAMTDLVAECIAVKAAVVVSDPQERTGRRAALNYGHTLAHALETVGHYDLRHGEAVAVGLAFAADLAHRLGRIDERELERSLEMLMGLGLPVTVPAPTSASDVLTVMQRDKKAHGGLTFVLPGDDGLSTVDDPPGSVVEAALAAVGVTG